MARWMRHHRPSLAMRVLAFACVGLTFSNAALACPGAMAAMAAEAAAKAAQGKAQQKRSGADQKEQQAKQAEQAAKDADEKAKQADEAVKKASDEARDLLNQAGSKPPVDQAQITQKQQELAAAQARLKELETLNAQINAPIAPATPKASGTRGLSSTDSAATGGSAVQPSGTSTSSASAVAQEMESVKAKIAKLQQDISTLQAGGQGGSTKPVDAPALKAANEKVKQLSEAAQQAHQAADKAHQDADKANKDAENANKDAEDGGKQQSGAADAAKAAAEAAPGMDKPFCISICPKPPAGNPEPCKSSCDSKCAGMAAAVKMAAGMIKSDGQKKQSQGQQGQQTAQKGQQQEQQLSQQENKYGQEAGGVAGAGGTGIDYSSGALGGGYGNGSGLGNLDVTKFEIGGVPVGSGPNASGANIDGATSFGTSDNPLANEYGSGGDAGANGGGSASDGTVGGGRSLASADESGAGGANGAGGAGYNFGGLHSGVFDMSGIDGAGAESGAEIPGFGGDSAKSDNPALDHQSAYRSLTGLDVEESSSRRLLTLWERAALRNQYFDIETGQPLADGRGRTLAGKNQMLSKAASRLGSDPTVIFMDKNAEVPKAVQPASAERK